jgi:hypothetical protein
MLTGPAGPARKYDTLYFMPTPTALLHRLWPSANSASIQTGADGRSALFGHREVDGRGIEQGLLEEAKRWCDLFWWSLTCLSLRVQSKSLRVLVEPWFQRVGSTDKVKLITRCVEVRTAIYLRRLQRARSRRTLPSLERCADCSTIAWGTPRGTFLFWLNTSSRFPARPVCLTQIGRRCACITANDALAGQCASVKERRGRNVFLARQRKLSVVKELPTAEESGGRRKVASCWQVDLQPPPYAEPASCLVWAC